MRRGRHGIEFSTWTAKRVLMNFVELSFASLGSTNLVRLGSARLESVNEFDKTWVDECVLESLVGERGRRNSSRQASLAPINCELAELPTSELMLFRRAGRTARRGARCAARRRAKRGWLCKAKRYEVSYAGEMLNGERGSMLDYCGREFGKSISVSEEISAGPSDGVELVDLHRDMGSSARLQICWATSGWRFAHDRRGRLASSNRIGVTSIHRIGVTSSHRIGVTSSHRIGVTSSHWVAKISPLIGSLSGRRDYFSLGRTARLLSRSVRLLHRIGDNYSPVRRDFFTWSARSARLLHRDGETQFWVGEASSPGRRDFFSGHRPGASVHRSLSERIPLHHRRVFVAKRPSVRTPNVFWRWSMILKGSIDGNDCVKSFGSLHIFAVEVVENGLNEFVEVSPRYRSCAGVGSVGLGSFGMRQCQRASSRLGVRKDDSVFSFPQKLHATLVARQVVRNSPRSLLSLIKKLIPIESKVHLIFCSSVVFLGHCVKTTIFLMFSSLCRN
ncbi:hypothetical protein ISN45_Aa05g011090 [Arabidopsis thaliana x Arabidopsis arenosa]|uniref:Uncharacterized protein n=1 Tax=Arabidopsis thaliana x Arabidopsis arenosa TaxID=1240361 RepID=A0A8T1ZJN4_9BRAS|nr:hypothetical protein ISN45_Aa05g011090 [Arabidopsis thaliana x Arabidopsis arenosa]